MKYLNLPITIQFKNSKNQSTYFIKDVNQVTKSKILLEKITKICNQKRVYEILFKAKLEDQPYPLSWAESFINKAKFDWQENLGFVFLIFTEYDEVVGAIDIKSNNLAESEIGYWADENHSGLMTPTVRELIQIAKQANYQKLYALIRIDNFRSQRVVEKNNFKIIKKQPHKELANVEVYRYELVL